MTRVVVSHALDFPGSDSHQLVAKYAIMAAVYLIPLINVSMGMFSLGA